MTALTVGPEDASEAIKKALQMGADKGVHVVDDAIAGSDYLATSQVLAAAVEKIGDVDVVMCGMASTDATGSVGPDLDDLKPDDYLSIPSITAPDGSKQAVAISVFPAALRGVGEGESSWDLGEGSLMTNAAFATMQAQGADHTIVVTYKGEQETVSVPEGTPIMAFGPAPDRKLAVGEAVIFFAIEVDGKLTSGRAGVMEDGSLPPI